MTGVRALYDGLTGEEDRRADSRRAGVDDVRRFGVHDRVHGDARDLLRHRQHADVVPTPRHNVHARKLRLTPHAPTPLRHELPLGDVLHQVLARVAADVDADGDDRRPRACRKAAHDIAQVARLERAVVAAQRIDERSRRPAGRDTPRARTVRRSGRQARYRARGASRPPRSLPGGRTRAPPSCCSSRSSRATTCRRRTERSPRRPRSAAQRPRRGRALRADGPSAPMAESRTRFQRISRRRLRVPPRPGASSSRTSR